MQTSRLKDGLLLLGVVLAMLGGMALATAAGLFVDGTHEAQAQTVPPVDVGKSDTGQASYSGGDTVEWWISFSDTSQTVQTYQFNDLLPDGLTFESVQGPASPLSCAQSGNGVVCFFEGNVSGTYFARVRATVNLGAECGPRTNSVRVGGTLGQGDVVATHTIQIIDCKVPATTTIQLCKQWPSNGVLSGQRTFEFEVSDTSQTFQTTIEVTEGGAEGCVPVTLTDGPVRITELVPIGFDTPTINFDNLVSGESQTVDFAVSNGECLSPLGSTEQVMALVQEFACTITYTNTDNDTPTVTTTPVTATPTFAACARCNTPPVPTSTNTPVPTNTPTPVVTQAPPTATPTTATGSGTGGLTDEQRTQTAVAAARTAAAQQTPLPPRTGLGGDGGAGSSFNVALFALGLLVLSSGLGLIAVRGKR